MSPSSHIPSESAGSRVRARREWLGLSVEELAMAAGLEALQLEAYEAGAAVIPSRLLRLLSDLLEAPL